MVIYCAACDIQRIGIFHCAIVVQFTGDNRDTLSSVNFKGSVIGNGTVKFGGSVQSCNCQDGIGSVGDKRSCFSQQRVHFG